MNMLLGLAEVEVVSGRAVTIDYRNPTDMLIPRRLMGVALGLKRSRAEWADVAAYLLNRYEQRVLALAPEMSGYRMLYQQSEQDLQRICYRPFRDVQIRLRILSLMTRRSMTSLISLMLEWEGDCCVSHRQPPARGVPTRMAVTWSIQGAAYSIWAHVFPISFLPRPGPAR